MNQKTEPKCVLTWKGKNCCIIHAWAGISLPRLSKGVIEWQPITILIDSGSAQNFLDPSFVNKNECCTCFPCWLSKVCILFFFNFIEGDHYFNFDSEFWMFQPTPTWPNSRRGNLNLILTRLQTVPNQPIPTQLNSHLTI